jgi:CRP-like cAMP-binding protein
MKRGAALLIEGQLDRTVYLLVSGSLRTLLYHADGQEVWLTDASPGELAGEIAALTGGARTSSVFTRSQVCVVAVEQAAFLSIAAEHGVVGLAVARLLARRLAHTSRQMADLAALPVASRLHRELLRLGHPSKTNGELVRLEEPPSVSALAQRIHASRETTSRALRELERHGRVRREAAAWIVPMPLESTDVDIALPSGGKLRASGTKRREETKRRSARKEKVSAIADSDE